MTTPEGKIKSRTDKILKEAKVFYFSPQAGPYGRAGIPDRIACVGGLFVGIECKANPSSKQTALQTVCQTSIEKNGGVYFLVYDDSTLNKLRDYLIALNRITKSPNPKAGKP